MADVGRHLFTAVFCYTRNEEIENFRSEGTGIVEPILLSVLVEPTFIDALLYSTRYRYLSRSNTSSRDFV